MSSKLWSELLAVYKDSDGKECCFLDMNSKGTLFLTVGDDIHDKYGSYSFLANSEGFKEAQKMVDIISDWIKRQKEIT